MERKLSQSRRSHRGAWTSIEATSEAGASGWATSPRRCNAAKACSKALERRTLRTAHSDRIAPPQAGSAAFHFPATVCWCSSWVFLPTRLLELHFEVLSSHRSRAHHLSVFSWYFGGFKFLKGEDGLFFLHSKDYA